MTCCTCVLSIQVLSTCLTGRKHSINGKYYYFSFKILNELKLCYQELPDLSSWSWFSIPNSHRILFFFSHCFLWITMACVPAYLLHWMVCLQGLHLCLTPLRSSHNTQRGALLSNELIHMPCVPLPLSFVHKGQSWPSRNLPSI